MRELLFKAKTIDGKRWVEGYYFAKPILNRYFIICDEAQWEVDVNTICQYTGLIDKNGNKIWENDVVRVGWKDNEAQAEEIHQVAWTKHGFTPWIEEFYCDGCDLFNEIFFVEVIGNIFDNADLVKE